MSNSFSYEDAFEASLSYFGEEELPAKIVVDKYLLRNNDEELVEQSPAHIHSRIASELARIESTKFKNPLSKEQIYEYLDGFKRIIPQGSPIAGIGNPYQYVTISNCYVIPPMLDSYGGIHRTDEHLSQISKRRGGVGFDISHIRPAGSITKNSSRTSTGIVPFMERASNSIREVGQSGRRGALMITISVHHPEILEFATVKRDLKRVTGANISVRLTDEFLKAVEEDRDYEQRWPVDSSEPKIKLNVNAREVWKKIIENAHAVAEPGLLFWDTIIRESPADCYADLGFKTVSTNPSLQGDTLVLTSKGAIPIKKLAQMGQKIRVLNAKLEWKEADVFQSGKNKRLSKITFTSGHTIFCTPEHKWPILNSTNHLAHQQTGTILKKRTDELKRRDKIYFPLIQRPINNSDCKFTKEDGFLCGWNLSDGWQSIHIGNGGHKQFGFIFSNEDVESGIAKFVLDKTNSIAKIPSKLRQDHDSKAVTYVTTDSNVRAYFENFQIQNKSEGLPLSIWESNHDFIHGIIDGIFSGDGNVYVGKKLSTSTICLVSAYEKLVNDVRKLLAFYGIRASICHSLKKGTFPNGKNYDKLYHRYTLTVSGIFVKKFASIFSLSNKKKQKALETILKFNFDEYANNRDYLVVKSVETTDRFEDVYDITVHDDTHTFITETGLTGNCSELPLSILDSCRLLVLNLFHYVNDPFTSHALFDFARFNADAQIAQRLMDDIVDLEAEAIQRIIDKINNDPESESIKSVELEMWRQVLTNCLYGRRTGTGITALGDTLAALGLSYGSDISIDTTEEIYRQLKLACYRSSVDMAKELGPFTLWIPELEKDNPFLSRIKDEDFQLYSDMMTYGRRNIALLTTAPVGTISNLAAIDESIKIFGTTSGIEPAFKLEYTRKKKHTHDDKNARVDSIDDMGDKWQHFQVYHPAVRKWMQVTGETDLTKSPWWGCCADDIDWQQRVKLQAAANRHVDHAISSTVNLPEDVTVEKVAEIYEAAWKAGCKGITVYRNNCRSGVLVDKETPKGNPIKRPRELPCDIYHVAVKGERHYVFVGLLNGEPYEVMASKEDEHFHVPRSWEKGIMRRIKRGFYQLVVDDKTVDNANRCGGDEEALTRMTSTALRHGVEIGFVVQQLEKSRGEIHSFGKSVARALKHYIKDGTKISGESCSECGSEKLSRQEGCSKCLECGSSKCS